MPSLVDVIITVTKFTANPSAVHPAGDKPLENCEISSELNLSGIAGSPAGKFWKSEPTGQVLICPPPDAGTIAIRKLGNAPVEFSFVLASGPGVPALRPTAIVFEQQKFKDNPGRPLRDPDGSGNFEIKGAAGNKLTVADLWVAHGKSKDRAKHAAPFWKFWIRVETTDAAGTTLKGWIDPTIENSEDMAP